MHPDEKKWYLSSGGFLYRVTTGHEDGPYTFIPGRAGGQAWIRTEDLHRTAEEARTARPARFLGEDKQPC